MIPKDLLAQLSHLEAYLNYFSYEKLSADKARELKKSFQSFKRNLFEKFSQASAKDGEESSKVYNETVSYFEKLSNEGNGPDFNLDMKTYDDIIKHYRSYEALLKSLNIQSAMENKTRSALSANEPYSSVNHFSKGIDLKPMLEECLGKTDLLAELIRLYERNALEFIGAAKIHLQTGDFKQLGLAAHKVKAGLAMMKTYDLHSIIVQIEHVCKKDQDIKHLKFLCNCFEVEFPIEQQALKRALVNITQNKG